MANVTMIGMGGFCACSVIVLVGAKNAGQHLVYPKSYTHAFFALPPLQSILIIYLDFWRWGRAKNA